MQVPSTQWLCQEENLIFYVLRICIDLLLGWRSSSIKAEEGEGKIDVCVDVINGTVGAAIPPLAINIGEGTAKKGHGKIPAQAAKKAILKLVPLNHEAHIMVISCYAAPLSFMNFFL